MFSPSLSELNDRIIVYESHSLFKKLIVKYSLLDSNDAARVRLKKLFKLFTQYISSLQRHHQDTEKFVKL